MITKTLTAGILSAMLALTSIAPTTASAEATQDEVLGGIIALLLFGAAVNELRDRNDDDDRHPTPAPAPANWRDLPEHCELRVRARNGNRVNYFTRACLTRHYAFNNRLPERCYIQFRDHTGDRRLGYRTQCLQNAGFRTNRH